MYMHSPMEQIVLGLEVLLPYLVYSLLPPALSCPVNVHSIHQFSNAVQFGYIIYTRPERLWKILDFCLGAECMRTI